jgi:glycosyltransferase involved in cell wall biosynthesis
VTEGKSPGGGRPRVSVGLPVYNGERFLRDAIDSVLAQDLDGLEVVVCDNASTDGTGEICRDYAARDPRIRYHRNRVNIGGPANYRLAFHLARGEYFKWAAHDDRFEPSFLRRCVEVLDARPGVVLCYSLTARIDEDGRTSPDPVEPLEVDAPDAYRRFRRLVWSLGLPYPVYGLARSSALGRTGLIRAFEGSDRLMLAELSLLGSFHQIPEVLFYYRSYDVSYLSRTRRSWGIANDRSPFTYPWRLCAHSVRAIRATDLPARQQARLAADAFGRFVVKESRKNLVRAVRAEFDRRGWEPPRGPRRSRRR